MPTSRAIASTVAGASPEITRSSTPSERRNSTVSRASGRSASDRTTRPSGSSPAGGPSFALNAPVAVPNATTRRPCACSREATSARGPRGNRSGAPSTYEVSPSRSALQRRADENGTYSPGSSAGAPTATAIASSVRLRAGELDANRPTSRRTSSGSPPFAASTETTRRSAAVSVPVLSRQMTSTEASDSIAFSCCASAPRRASCNAAAAKVRLASRISPSGTSVTMPATAVVTASWISMSRCQSE